MNLQEKVEAIHNDVVVAKQFFKIKKYIISVARKKPIANHSSLATLRSFMISILSSSVIMVIGFKILSKLKAVKPKNRRNTVLK